MIEFERAPDEPERGSDQQGSPHVSVRVIGVGGGAGRMLSRLRRLDIDAHPFTVFNTNEKELRYCRVRDIVRLGKKCGDPWGTGGDPAIGRKMVLAAREQIRKHLQDVDVVVLVATLGKGMGSGGAPALAQLMHELETLTVGFVTLPFAFEGKQRARRASEAVGQLRAVVDALIVVPNEDTVRRTEKPKLSLREGLEHVDRLLEHTLMSLRDVLFQAGLIDVDLADFRALLQQGRRLCLATGEGRGEKAPEDAAEQALNGLCPAGADLERAQGVLLAVHGGPTLALEQLQRLVGAVNTRIASDTDVSFGVYLDDAMKDRIRVTMLVAGDEMWSRGDEGKTVLLDQREMEFSNYDEQDLDVPAFLRRRKN